MFTHSTVRRSWRAAALTVALPLMLASSAAASAGQQAAGNAPHAAAAAKTNVAQVIAPPSRAVIRSSTFEGSCGLFTCTVRLNRPATRNARDASWVISTAASMCGFIPPPGNIICGAAVAAGAVIVAVAAGRFYEQGDCLAINFNHPPLPSAAWPSKVSRGDHNCG
jgi:hypothetical protein